MSDDLIKTGAVQETRQRIGAGFAAEPVCLVAHVRDQGADVLVKGANRSLMILPVDLTGNTVTELLGKDSLHHAPAQRSRDEPAAVIILPANRAVFLIAGKDLPAPFCFGLLKQAAPILIALNTILDAVLNEPIKILVDFLEESMNLQFRRLVRCHTLAVSSSNEPAGLTP